MKRAILVVSLFAVFTVCLQATTKLSSKLHYLELSSSERIDMSLSSTFGSMMALWAYGTDTASGFKEYADTIEKTNNEHFHAKLNPDPHGIKNRAEAIAALSQYDKACVKKMKPASYRAYRIGVATGTVFWICVTYDKRRSEALAPQDVKTVKSCLESIIVDVKAIGAPNNIVKGSEQFKEDGLKAKTGQELIKACFMIDSWNTMLSSMIGNVVPLR